MQLNKYPANFWKILRTLKFGLLLKISVSILFPVLVITCTPFLLQMLHCDGNEKILWWYQHFTGAYYCNVFVVLFLFLVWYLILNSTYSAALGVMGFSFIIGLIDSQKMRILHQPFVPGDLLFVRQSLLIAKIYAVPVLGAVFILIIALIILSRARKQLYHFSLPPLIRIIATAAFLIASVLIVKNYDSIIDSLNRNYKVCDEFWNQLGNYHKNGFYYSFVMNIGSLKIEKPSLYSREKVEAIFNPWAGQDSASSSQKNRSPDVIIVLSESFWDITRISPVKIPCDPIKHFRKISRKFPSLKLLSPTFGGNTCNAEFEILTGLSHGFFPEGVTAYNQSITRPVPSVVQVFKANGYRTTGIHTFKQWFWNRTNVYRYLGFDSFISQEIMDKPKYKGFYISDEELAHQIISAASKKGQPDFIFAISMQNHGPYDLKRYDKLDCPVSSGLSTVADLELNSYIQGTIDADKSLKMLTRYIDTTKTPTLLLFFGDHLPGFSRLYKETGYGERVRTDTVWAHTTPSVWYSNYKLKKFPDTLISMCFVPLLVTQQAGVTVPVYYKFLSELRKKQPQFSLAHLNRDTVGNDSSSLQLDSMSLFSRLYEYDLLFGKRYASRFYDVTQSFNLNSAVDEDEAPQVFPTVPYQKR
ncbi:MAG TPA: LTA synthase family protein [Chitinispirillaceae bacterium]|nr:LTA synthase family protein [Chitinispirillaceae bacterium]